MWCTFLFISILIYDFFYSCFYILSVRFHDLNHFAYREFISLFNPVQSVFNLSYDTKICVLSDIRITVINLAFFTWFSKIKSCRELTIGTI